jgi:hypothetical protein
LVASTVETFPSDERSIETVGFSENTASVGLPSKVNASNEPPSRSPPKIPRQIAVHFNPREGCNRVTSGSKCDLAETPSGSGYLSASAAAATVVGSTLEKVGIYRPLGKSILTRCLWL